MSHTSRSMSVAYIYSFIKYCNLSNPLFMQSCHMLAFTFIYTMLCTSVSEWLSSDMYVYRDIHVTADTPLGTPPRSCCMFKELQSRFGHELPCGHRHGREA